VPRPLVWLRNALIGAALVSFNAVFGLVARPTDRDAQLTALTLVIAGLAAGLCFTALTPLRNTSRLGNYATWVGSVYVVLAAVIVASWLDGSDVFVYSLRIPIGLVFWLGSGLVTGIFCARVAERWSKGDFR
jgi:hypothetical protein